MRVTCGFKWKVVYQQSGRKAQVLLYVTEIFVQGRHKDFGSVILCQTSNTLPENRPPFTNDQKKSLVVVFERQLFANNLDYIYRLCVEAQKYVYTYLKRWSIFL